MKVTYVKKGTMKPSKPFKSLEEEANFWDTHSVLDDINEETVVGFHRANKTDTITIRFQPEHIQVLKEQANQMGIGPTTLARMWIIEKLNKNIGHTSLK
ncbi:MAG: CopG family antitoxin [Candidatus Daviesbacteria bacterium]|nr:CopG family antitoxin [Candidatus Daviesbacteria bacterium]